jgi:hypothetical protein
MAEAANWGNVPGLTDSASERSEPESGSAYVMPMGEGLSKPRGFRAAFPEDKEPLGVWVMVVGSIFGLVLIAKGFRTVKA